MPVAVGGGAAPATNGALSSGDVTDLDGVLQMIRILVADDHDGVREGLIYLLRYEPGFKVVGVASDGREAVDLVREHQPDVVVMDVAMPVLDGVEAVRIIKRYWPYVRVLGLSTDDAGGSEIRMLKAGAERYLHKGSPSQLLLDTIFELRLLSE